MSITKHTEAVYQDQLNRELDFLCQEEGVDFDLLEQAESKAPKFSIHKIKLNQYIVIIDPFYVAQWGFKFDSKNVQHIIGIECAQVFEDTILYFKSAFPVSMLEDSIKLSFL